MPPFLLRGVGRAIDLGVQLVLLEVAFRISEFMPSKGLIHVEEGALFWIDLSVGLAALITYTTLSEWLGAATFGKFCTGQRVVRAEGERAPIPLWSAFVRNILFLVDGVMFGIVAYGAMARSDRNQRVGDEFGRTVVVWRAEGPDRSALIGWPIGALAALLLVVSSYLVAS